jgi:hypothetical protein
MPFTPPTKLSDLGMLLIIAVAGLLFSAIVMAQLHDYGTIDPWRCSAARAEKGMVLSASTDSQFRKSHECTHSGRT